VNRFFQTDLNRTNHFPYPHFLQQFFRRQSPDRDITNTILVYTFTFFVNKLYLCDYKK
jgi:hypothetical protein